MMKIVPLKVEIENALDLLNANEMPRAAFRLERASQRILHSTPAPRKPQTRVVKIVGGSGRSYPVKLNVPTRGEDAATS